MKIINEKKLHFRDVLIKPKPSELSSRNDVNLIVKYITKHSNKMFCGVPVCVANMDTVGTINMAKSLFKHKMWVALNKFIDAEDLISFLNTEESKYSFVTIGSSKEDYHKLLHVDKVVNKPINICMDVANGYMYSFLDHVKIVRDNFPRSIIMAGNVCTPEGVENIIKAGADIAKCGIANGAFCDTKNKAAIGYPQLSVAIECGQAANELNAMCCSDGGVTTPADICKALAAGSHLVMCGSIFGGHTECSGDVVEIHGKKYLEMYGMSSKKANEKYFGGLKSYRASEGTEGVIPYKGDVDATCVDIKGSLASCCTYTNTANLENLYKHSQFILV